MTDRQIMIAFFPDSLPKPVKPAGESYRDVFWKIARGRGWTEAQTQAEWDRQAAAVGPHPAGLGASHVRG